MEMRGQLQPWGESPQYPLNKMLDWPNCQSEHSCGEKKIPSFFIWGVCSMDVNSYKVSGHRFQHRQLRITTNIDMVKNLIPNALFTRMFLPHIWQMMQNVYTKCWFMTCLCGTTSSVEFYQHQRHCTKHSASSSSHSTFELQNHSHV
jgi:hypothetical protein